MQMLAIIQKVSLGTDSNTVSPNYSHTRPWHAIFLLLPMCDGNRLQERSDEGTEAEDATSCELDVGDSCASGLLGRAGAGLATRWAHGT